MGNQSKVEIILSAVDRGLTAGFNRALGRIKSFVAGAREAETGVMGLTGAVSGLLGPLLGAVSAAAGLQKLVGVSREFDKISAGLVTATGSAEGSEQAFAAVQDFAARTPYDLAQVTESFIKLVNFGLDPSERALTSYGNTSSALGKDLNQMIEAVADAATGEFERLKEFGIKASSEGDKVSFTFRGVTTTVGKNAKEIEEYLIKLGETNFGDAMANRMKTLDGALSNLGDEWNKVFLNISRAGIGNLIADGVRVGIGALEELNAQIASGELEGYLRSNAAQFGGWADDVKAAIETVKQWYRDNLEEIKVNGQDAVTFLINAFRQFPENVRAFIGLMTVQVAAGLDKVTAYARAFKAGVAAIFNGQSFAGVGAELERELSVIDTARDASVQSILDQRDATIKAADDERAAAKQLRAEYDVQQATAKANTADKLVQFRVQTAASQASAKEEAKARKEGEKAAKKAATEAKKEYQEQKKIAAEKLRAASQEKILAMELEKLEASKLPTAWARAEAELAIDRRIMAERVSLKRQELAAMQEDAARPDSNTSQADIIRAESELAEMRLEVSRQELAGQREIARARLDAISDSWRQSAASIEEYKAAVTEAYRLGLMETREYNERMIAAGSDMGAAFSLGLEKAKLKMQTDGEMMIQIGEGLADQLAGGLVSAWDGFITQSKSAKEALIDFARSTISWLSQVILKQMLMNALLGATGTSGGGLLGMLGMATTGAPALTMADGGSVPGWSPTPTADNIWARLTAREFVHPVDAVDFYGLPFMEMVRRKLFPRNLARALAGATLPRIPSGYRLAQGGQPAAPPTTTVKAGDFKLAVVNVRDESEIHRYVNSADFDRVLINKINRNGSTINTALGRR